MLRGLDRGQSKSGLEGNASTGAVGTAIHDEVTVTGGFSPYRGSDLLRLRAGRHQLLDTFGNVLRTAPERQRYLCGFHSPAGRGIPLDRRI